MNTKRLPFWGLTVKACTWKPPRMRPGHVKPIEPSFIYTQFKSNCHQRDFLHRRKEGWTYVVVVWLMCDGQQRGPVSGAPCCPPGSGSLPFPRYRGSFAVRRRPKRWRCCHGCCGDCCRRRCRCCIPSCAPVAPGKTNECTKTLHQRATNIPQQNNTPETHTKVCHIHREMVFSSEKCEVKVGRCTIDQAKVQTPPYIWSHMRN